METDKIIGLIQEATESHTKESICMEAGISHMTLKRALKSKCKPATLDTICEAINRLNKKREAILNELLSHNKA